ncbi:NUDIX hydrolase [Jeongeupia sp. USM3]|uniref:NUDIX hydrolase n=1 Tax=Jeongeupia sp. USM3 TaxID=1906741 RepID=UPI00089DE752|nr:NUDIX hydrolase [Jeongeupia sp. USM3]AOY02081.1 hypothetical protein BJP62_17515 [Jeongeupia sp. USM3]
MPDLDPPRLLRSQAVFQARDMQIRADTYALPGRAEPWVSSVLEYPDWVSAFALTRDHHVLLVRQYRPGIRQYSLEVPGGWVKPDDPSLEAAIRRELQEETGHRFGELRPLVAVSPNPATHNNRLHCFLALDGMPAQALPQDDDEQISVQRLPLAEVTALLRNRELFHNGHLTCIFYALLELGLLAAPGPDQPSPGR